MIINISIYFGLFIDDEYDNSITIIKAFYRNFVEQQVIPEYLENEKEILNYFNSFENYIPIDELISIKTKEENPEKKVIKILRDIFFKFKNYFT